MVVEGDYVDPALGKPGDDLGLGIEIVGLVSKMIAGVSAKAGSQALDAVKNFACILCPPQASFPGPGHAVEDRGDAVGEGLSIAFQQRHIDWEPDAWPRHHLSLEGIAVNVDDSGKDQKAGGVDRPLGG